MGNLGFLLGLGGVLGVPLDLWWDLLSCCLGATHLQQGFAGGLLSCCNVGWLLSSFGLELLYHCGRGQLCSCGGFDSLQLWSASSCLVVE